jgi:hypothetical protein
MHTTFCSESRQDFRQPRRSLFESLDDFRYVRLVIAIAFVWLFSNILHASELSSEVDSFIQESCIGCHDASTDTRLDFTSLGRDLENDKTFRAWVRVFDRVRLGEMPPASEIQPSEQDKRIALSLLRKELKHVNHAAQQKVGRVPSRRLTRTEYEHTLHDLLGIGGDLSKHLPPENESGAFDVVAATQGMSSVHVRSFLNAADLALDEAIQLGPKPRMDPRDIDYFNSPYIQMWVDRPVRNGGGTIFKTGKDVVMFRGENYVFRSDASGFVPPVAGRYRITVEAAAYQQRSSITLSLKRQNDKQGDSELFAAWDLSGEDYREVSTTKYLRPDDYIYVSADELESAPNGQVIYNAKEASSFGGEGVRIRRVTVEGPLETSWPPRRTRDLLPGMEWEPRSESRQDFRHRRGSPGESLDDFRYNPKLTKPAFQHVSEIVSAFAPRALRRKVNEKEIDALVALAKPRLESGGDFVECAKIPLRAILISPEFLFQTGPAGTLDDRLIASRLSYFLWRSLPDKELNQLAADGQLTQADTLAAQVDRMLDDPKSERFVDDFLDQWLELGRIDATTPDNYLYPEYDDVLRRAMLAETRAFFAYLIEEDLSVTNLIDSEFTFLNRRLAEHYGIDGVEGEFIRKVDLDPGSVRGGILTHASIAKVTANGTVTTPVKRGNFVLTNLLGMPPKPPPPGVGAIEPDTRGATTIRETLEKHQALENCAVCHRQIDPPGFAMECFDPVGNFRERYRNSKGVKRETNIGLRFLHKDYELGVPVDTAGMTADGFAFDDIRDYKSHLKQSTEQVARNVLSKLFMFATGGEIEFADREEIERILQATKNKGYPLRTLIHQVVASRIFRNR